jgi:hypothetical protein
MKLFIILSIAFSLFAFGGTKPPENDPTAFWQQSETLNIQLGVRDKNALAESYNAVFSAENKALGIVYEAKIRVAKDDWGFVYFPQDFPPGVKDGEYVWNCTVNGKIVSSGSFKYSDDQRTLTIPKK